MDTGLSAEWLYLFVITAVIFSLILAQTQIKIFLSLEHKKLVAHKILEWGFYCSFF